MGDTTAIAWTEKTANFWMGCIKVSPGCQHCYAERLITERFKLNVWGPSQTTARQRTSKAIWSKPYVWNEEGRKRGKPVLVFCGSLMDWAEDHPMLDPWRTEMWEIIRKTPWVHWQLLTKRADRIARLLPNDWGQGFPNVWLGTSVEDQEWTDKRLPHLVKIPAVVHFVSYEPALGPVDFTPHLKQGHGIQWVIVGGESGPNYRPMPYEWPRAVRKQCAAAKVAYFFKQSAAPRTEMGTKLDGETVREYPKAPVPPYSRDIESVRRAEESRHIPAARRVADRKGQQRRIF